MVMEVRTVAASGGEERIDQERVQGGLKCTLYYYSDMVKPTDQEMTAIKKLVTHSSQQEGNLMPAGPHGEALSSIMYPSSCNKPSLQNSPDTCNLSLTICSSDV